MQSVGFVVRDAFLCKRVPYALLAIGESQVALRGPFAFTGVCG